MDFQEYWDKQIERLEKNGTAPAMMNRYYDECKKAWDAKPTPFNGLTPAELERLALLIEEQGEAQQAIGKILRHGYEEYSPFDESRTPNRVQLEKELAHVSFAFDMLEAAGDLNGSRIDRFVEEKKRNVVPYLHHQELKKS